jgi:GH25 family lysozyme M1 (1,4-beta-N-acetylmuramidase)
MNINRLVLDLSHHETVQSYDQVKADGIAGIIYKATQGTSYHDATYWKERKKAMDAGLLWGSYHFGDHSSVENQVRNYLEYTTVFKDELFCLDLEPNDDNSMTLNQAREWIIAVEAALNRAGQCVIYSGSTIKEMLGEQKDEFWGSRRLWLAQYGTTPVVQASWDTYWLWQYSDGENGPEPHDVNGIKDHVDSNSFDGTADELEAQWASGPCHHCRPPNFHWFRFRLLCQRVSGLK